MGGFDEVAARGAGDQNAEASEGPFFDAVKADHCRGVRTYAGLCRRYIGRAKQAWHIQIAQEGDQ